LHFVAKCSTAERLADGSENPPAQRESCNGQPQQKLKNVPISTAPNAFFTFQISLRNQCSCRLSCRLMYAEIIIPLALPKNYTWAIPEQWQKLMQPGLRVEVQLRNKKYAGVVKTLIAEKPAAFDPKPILNVLDEQPIIWPHQLALWQWMSVYYMCSEGEVMQAALPSHFKLSSETVLVFNEEAGDHFSHLDNNEYLLAEALLIKRELKISEVQQILDVVHVYPVVKRLIDKKICFAFEALNEKYKPRTESFVELVQQYNNEDSLSELLNNWGKAAPKQMELLLAYLHIQKTEGDVPQTLLLKKSGASAAQLKGLVEKGILQIEKRNTDRLKSLPRELSIDFDLSAQQQKAFAEMETHFATKQVCLLHGITGSGKTQLYIKLMEKALLAQEQVLYLLPEIALTAQMIRRLQKHFGGHISIYHSKFNNNERVEIWNKVKSGDIKIVLGARSALFLPFINLKMIIIDEEHDASYKQYEPAPRYNARDTAIYYAGQLGAKVLLGSATPSLESYYNAQQNKFGLIELTERFGAGELPVMEMVDTKTIAGMQGKRVLLSPQLQAAMEATLQAGKQIIVFQNRRGYSPYQTCNVCGWIPKCSNCNVSLTFHKAKHKLQCHYCGTHYPVVNTCAACGNHQFGQKNFGTEQVEEFLSDAFPNHKVSRMDYDSIRGKHDHDALIQQFEQKRIDILVGTQMVVKGLDFENVSLVCILDADGILNFADFRVNERGFQLMEQVSGRAGRKDALGKVMIQTSTPQHPVLQFVQQHNYVHLYDWELLERKNFFYPPFSRIIEITFKHKEETRAEEAANMMSEALKPKWGKCLIGPAQPVVNRVRNQYLMELLLKLPKNNDLLMDCKKNIQQQIVAINGISGYASVAIVPDVDPS
jgi:primosomal protein N' (replication factor Y) (superfamily II helicase)